MTLDEAILEAEREGSVQDAQLAGWLKELRDRRVPVPLILYCPKCDGRHIDKGEFAKRPHHTHACQHCGFSWRPAINTTVGVEYLPGFKDNDETP